ncbi:alpha/beta fold hydrolase [uncultured Methanobrevibacter sp.]|uniref:alpha/beta fold hydrolase n=1 Tax=uncultured Methanobrevibacter sp. TaxID=253161 RepID=UPI0025E907F1|nr:alpha/beta hydrolase [uncultured Methanobrevibacter sp.]
MTVKYFKELAYEDIGDENKETIIFLHTKLLDKWIWKKQKDKYNQYFNDYHCIFLDLPNHGDSKSNEPFSIGKSSQDIMEFIEYLIESKDIEKINLIGLGLGGSIAIEIMSRNPNLIDNLILSGLEIADFKEDEEDSIIGRLGKTQSKYLNEKPDTFIVKAYLRYFGISKTYFDYMERILDRSIKEEKKIAYESLNYTISDNLFKDDIPNKENILIIFGNKEDLDCTKSAIGLKSIFENAKLVEINKGNHLWNIIDDELFNSTIIDFIKFKHIESSPKVRILE